VHAVPPGSAQERSLHVPSDWQAKPDAHPPVWQGPAHIDVGVPLIEQTDGTVILGTPSSGVQTCDVGQLLDELQPVKGQGATICARGVGVCEILQISPAAQSALTLQCATVVDCDSLVPQPKLAMPVVSAIQSASRCRRIEPNGTGFEVDATRTIVPSCAIRVIV
jgi:hypothetical protein